MKQPGTILADTLKEDGQISEEQQDVYAYLFNYLFESLLFDILVLLIGILVHRWAIAVCYLLVTIPLRHFAGGFHANTKLGCTLLSYGIYLFTLWLAPALTTPIPQIWLLVYVIAWCFILPVAPVDTKNKRLSDEQKKKLSGSCIRTCILMSILVFLLWWIHQPLYYGTISICLMESAVSVYIGIWKNRRNL